MDDKVESIIEKIIKEKAIPREVILQKIKKKKEEYKGLISDLGAARLVAKELGVDINWKEIKGRLKIRDLKPGLRNICFVGKVISKSEIKEFRRGKNIGKVAFLILGDDTGFIKLVLWDKKIRFYTDIEKGDLIEVNGADIKESKFGLEAHLKGELKKLEGDIEVKERDVVGSKYIYELKSGDRVFVKGIIIYDLENYLVLDDGTGVLKIEKNKNTYNVGVGDLVIAKGLFTGNIFLPEFIKNLDINREAAILLAKLKECL